MATVYIDEIRGVFVSFHYSVDVPDEIPEDDRNEYAIKRVQEGEVECFDTSNGEIIDTVETEYEVTG